MNKKRALYLFVIVVLLFGVLALSAEASPLTRINDFFTNGEYKTHAKIIDFLIFFTMFFALAYLGFTKMWGAGHGDAGKGKGPIVALSISFGLALAFAIVSQTKFSITTLFPIAKAFLFLIVVLLLYGLLSQNQLIGNDTWTKKIISFLLAIILGYLVLNILTHVICLSENNDDDPACKGAFFTAGKGVLKGIGDAFGIGGGSSGGGSGGGGTSTSPTPGTHCRMDGSFVFDKTDYKNSGNLASFVDAVKKAGKKTIYIYGFASTEHEVGGKKGEKYNQGLSTRRAAKVKSDLSKIIKNKKYSISLSSSAKGQTKVFGAYANNRRFILSTQSISKGKETPAPAIAAVQGCKPASKTKPTPPGPTPPKPPNPDDPDDSSIQEQLKLLSKKLDRAENLLNEGMKSKDSANVKKVKQAVEIAEDVKDELNDLK